MQMTEQMSTPRVAPIALAIITIFAISFAITPLAIAASGGSDYPIEVIRAHTAYVVADPAALVTVGLGVQGNR